MYIVLHTNCREEQRSSTAGKIKITQYCTVISMTVDTRTKMHECLMKKKKFIVQLVATVVSSSSSSPVGWAVTTTPTIGAWRIGGMMAVMSTTAVASPRRVHVMGRGRGAMVRGVGRSARVAIAVWWTAPIERDEISQSTKVT